MAYQQGSTRVSQGSNADLTFEISHLSSICAQPCVFTGPDAEAGALTYAAVRVLLLRAIEQQSNMQRLAESVQTLSQETRTSLTSFLDELTGLRTHVSTLQQNMNDVVVALQGHGQRLDQLEAMTRSLGNIDAILSSFEQRILGNSNAIAQLDQQQRNISNQLPNFCSTELVERRLRELGDTVSQRLMVIERCVQEVQTQKADLDHVPVIVSQQLQTALSPLDADVSALYRLFDLDKNAAHNVTIRSNNATVQNRVQLMHGTPPFSALLQLLRQPSLPTVTVGPASVSGSSNITVSSA